MRDASFISEPITVIGASFDTAGMAMGEPGVPLKFRWRRKAFTVEAVLEKWKTHGDCAHGSGERYVRKHGYRIRTTDGNVFRLYFQRSFGRGKFTLKQRWWIHSMERTVPASPEAQ